ncbi:MAG: type I 3-dehydroquinate dehydratase [Eubacteriales bacterium]|nr:type I 3-dehydroquinate dehydratase [Eubacteriales bacterium]
MQPITKLRNLTLGEGMPKICVSVTGRTGEEIISSAKKIMPYHPDMIEWRMDFWNGAEHAVEAPAEKKLFLQLLSELRQILGETPLLSTFRTKAEGGERELKPQCYMALNELAIFSGETDAVDVELFQGDTVVKQLIASAHQMGVKVIGSNHDFQKTPPRKEIIRRLCCMQELGVDVAKMAVMPENKKDILTLLEATEEMHREYAKIPIVTMSMGGEGMITRLSGEVFGSALTFGMVGTASAPGQVPIGELRRTLELFHGRK